MWDRACQARTPRDNPVMLPIVPVAFPVPSYASDVFHEETALWFERVGRVVKDLRHPEGPIVLVQIDNEGALYFRDGPYDQDYHPDAIALFRAFLKTKYRHVDELRDAWRDPRSPPRDRHPAACASTRSDADDLPRHMDWMEFHEHLLVHAMRRMVDATKGDGPRRAPHDAQLPARRGGDAAERRPHGRRHRPDRPRLLPPRDPHRAQHHRAAHDRARGAVRGARPGLRRRGGRGLPAVLRRPSTRRTRSTRSSARSRTACADTTCTWPSSAIAGSARRSIRTARHRPLAAKYERLNAALDATEFHTLRRRAPVRLVVPRALRRLARASHAFGPITPAFFNILGAGFRESCLEEELGLGEVATMVGEAYLRAFEKALQARGVPFAYAGGDSFVESIEDAKWLVCATVGGVKPELVMRLREAAKNGHARRPSARASRRATDRCARCPAPHDITGLEVEPLDDGARADELVAKRIEELGLPAFPVDPEDVKMTVHEDAVRRAARRLRDEPDRERSRRARLGARSPLARRRALPRADRRAHRAGIAGFEVNAPVAHRADVRGRAHAHL